MLDPKNIGFDVSFVSLCLIEAEIQQKINPAAILDTILNN